MRRAVILSVAIILSGCAATSSPLPSPPPPGSSDSSLVAAQDFVIGGELPDNHADFPMYGIIALSDNSKRSKWVCETFTRLPPVEILQEGGVGSVSKERITPTYWLLKKDAPRSDCDALRDNYDFDRAKAVFSLAERAGEKGTLLVAYKDNRFAVLDISKANKKWTKAMVAKWSAAMRANGMKDITVKGGVIADTCAILTGNDSRRVEAAVYEVVKADLADAAPPYEGLIAIARDFAIELIPFGSKVQRLANATCDEVNRSPTIT